MVQSRALQAQADVKRKLPVAWDFVMDDIHPQSKTLTARIGFYKVGDMQFISHLDLQRFMKRAFVRSGLPIWFSEGFNPHPKMVFSTPLSIGIQSECEFADIKMTAPVTPAQIVDALNPCMPDTLQLFYAAPPMHKMTDIGYASYDIRITHPKNSADLAAAMDELYAKPLILTKKSKAGDRDTDITPFIKSAKTDYAPTTGEMTVHCLLCADNANFLNPEYLMRGAERDLGLVFDDPTSAWYETVRKDIFLQDGVTLFL